MSASRVCDNLASQLTIGRRTVYFKKNEARFCCLNSVVFSMVEQRNKTVLYVYVYRELLASETRWKSRVD